jgi:hypothetical protein
METTTNLGICKPSARWEDEHPGGCGFAGVVSEALDNIDSALSSGGMLRTVSVEVSSAQLLAMKATPVVVVPAMDGFAVYPISAVINYYPVSVDYALGDATSLCIAVLP